MSDVDREVWGEEDGAAVLDDLEEWFGRFICVSFDGDLALLALWAVHTHLAGELRTTPRLQLDSPMPESGKTTVLDHFSRLCHRPIQIASAVEALLPREAPAHPICTVSLDEWDRILTMPRAHRARDLNSGRSGRAKNAAAPMPAPAGWDASESHVPPGRRPGTPRSCLMTPASASPGLAHARPGRHRGGQRSGYVEEDAHARRKRIEAFAEAVRDDVAGRRSSCDRLHRPMKEKWRPLQRVTVGRRPLAGRAMCSSCGTWPRLRPSVRPALRAMPPAVALLTDLAAFWPESEPFLPTRHMIERPGVSQR